MTDSLGCSELCIPGKFEDKLALMEDLGLWLEVTNIGPRDLSVIDSYNIEVVTVQAYQLHKLHWLSSDKGQREAAKDHVLDSIRLAEDLGADNLLTVPTYGFDTVGGARDVCIGNYKSLSKETHLNILIEALSPNQTDFLSSLSAVAGLIKEISRDNVGLAADTWHISESGEDVIGTLKESKSDIVELHLRDSDSLPPGLGNMDFKGILDVSSSSYTCLEYSEGTNEDLTKACRHIRSITQAQ